MMGRRELDNIKLILKEDEIEGFLERTVKPIGTSGMSDIPRWYIGQRIYFIITKNPGTVQENGKK